MATPAVPPNRAQRRASGSTGSRRKPVIAGSLLTVGGLFGAYLGYIRPPAAFAVTGCPSGATEFNPAGATPSTDLQTMIDDEDRVGDTICITSGFTMNADVSITTSVTLIGASGGTRPLITATSTNDQFVVPCNRKSLIIQDLDFAVGEKAMFYFDHKNMCPDLSASFTNCDFSGESDLSINAYGGGTLRFSNVDITGAGVHAYANKTYFDDVNIAGSLSGLRAFFADKLVIDNSTFDNTGAALYGYALDDDDIAVISNTSFTNNVSSANSRPINLRNGDVTLSDVTFSNNARTGSLNTSGAVLLRFNDDVVIDGSRFTGNTTTQDGFHKGVLHVHQSSTLTMGSSQPNSFSDNGSAGGSFVSSIWLEDVPVINVSNTSFTRNVNAKSAMYVARISEPSTYTGALSGSSFTSNTSSVESTDLMLQVPVPGFSITTSRFASRSALNANAIESLGSGNTFTDEVPSGGGDTGVSSGGSAGTTESATNTTTPPATTAPAPTPTATLIPVTFADASKVVPSQFESLTPAQVASIPYPQFKELTPEVFKVLTAAQVAALPLDLIRAIRPARLAAIKPAAIAGMSGEQLSTLRLASVRAMSPQQVAAIGNETIKSVAPAFMAQLKPKVLAAMDPAVIAALSPEQAAAIRPAALARLSISSLRLLDENTFAALSVRQLGKLTPRQVAQLTDKQRAALTATQRLALRRG